MQASLWHGAGFACSNTLGIETNCVAGEDDDCVMIHDGMSDDVQISDSEESAKSGAKEVFDLTFSDDEGPDFCELVPVPPCKRYRGCTAPQH